MDEFVPQLRAVRDVQLKSSIETNITVSLLEWGTTAQKMVDFAIRIYDAKFAIPCAGLFHGFGPLLLNSGFVVFVHKREPGSLFSCSQVCSDELQIKVADLLADAVQPIHPGSIGYRFANRHHTRFGVPATSNLFF